MTIIVADAKARVMVADTLVTQGAVKSFHSHKIIRCKDGSLAGAAGGATDCATFLAWAKKGRKGKISSSIFRETCGVILELDGTLLSYDGVEPDVVINGFIAIGAGTEVATGVRYYGHTAEECAKAAAAVCTACGGEITVLHLDKV